MMPEFHRLPVTELRKLTANSVAIRFGLTDANRKAFSFHAGQYITIRHKGSDGEVRRAYSICSTPGSGELVVGVKKVDGGTFSVFANSQLRVGDVLEVMTPQGRFTYEPGVGIGNLLAIAAGSGITPIMSIIRTALEEDPLSRVVLVYGNRSQEETMFLSEIQELQSKYSDRFNCYYVYSRNRYEDALFGRIERSSVNFVTKNKHRDLQFDRYFLCGPEAMIDTVRETILDQGVSADHILHELFTEPEGETSPEGIADTIPDGQCRVRVILDDVPHELVMDPHQRVLDAVLSAKIDAPYSCQGGVCSTCIARVKEGTAEMAKNQILTDSEIAEGLILTCQAHPKTPVLTVDYDDV